MAWWVKAPNVRSEDLSSILRIHMVEGESLLLQVVL